jgi:hypothetical protein
MTTDYKTHVLPISAMFLSLYTAAWNFSTVTRDRGADFVLGIPFLEANGLLIAAWVVVMLGSGALLSGATNFNFAMIIKACALVGSLALSAHVALAVSISENGSAALGNFAWGFLGFALFLVFTAVPVAVGMAAKRALDRPTVAVA